MDKRERIKNLIEQLNEASKTYYQEAREIMSNLEYDKLYDELVELEKETGIVLSNSPTQKVGYEILSDLPKEEHPSKMLSLDKTKEVSVLQDWLGDKDGLLSWKLDGLTVVLTYQGGKLVKGLTRGNGEIGEVITSNVKVFANVPVSIPFEGKVVLRGEALIKYSDFEKINEEIGDIDAKYKNPRNLCSGSVRQLNSEITAKRNVNFIAFNLVEAEGKTFKLREDEYKWLEELGFDVVERHLVNASNIQDRVDYFADKIVTNDFPSDGLVLTFNDIEYGKSLGTTAKFPRDSIAFKWRDEQQETTLEEIEWSPSRTGLINPVAVFTPVELEGTTVSRASVHNISIMEELELGIGDRIVVYKANMIIPQIADNLTRSGNMPIPTNCPVCGCETSIKNENDAKTLVCPNPECQAKQIKKFTLFVSRDAMNIDGLSEATIEKLIAKGLIKNLADLFQVEKYKTEIIQMEGFGETSFHNLKKSIEKAKDVIPARLLYALGIPGIGVSNARLIAEHCKNNWEKMIGLTFDELLEIEGIGDIMAKSYVEFFEDEQNRELLAKIMEQVKIDETYEEGETFLDGLTFVITGSLNHYQNRDELKKLIQNAGGKVAGSVSAKTNYLINNDLLSNSGKNKKAKELGIKIIPEETIETWLNSGVVKED